MKQLKVKRLIFQQLTKSGKRQVISYIRKTYEGAHIRDIVNNLYQAFTDIEGKNFIGISFDLTKHYKLTH